MAIIKCKNCGGNVSDKAKACPHCGRVLEQNVTPPLGTGSNPSREPQGEVSKNTRKGKSPKKTILAILGGILLLFVAIIAFVFFRYGIISPYPSYWENLIKAEQGDAFWQYSLGNDYFHGMQDIGFYVPQDYSKAVKWFLKAAEQGDSWAQNDLGHCYSEGYGVSQDYNEAVRWYRKAAEQGNQDAINALQRLGYQ